MPDPSPIFRTGVALAPVGIVSPMGGGEAVPEEAVIIFDFDLVHLQPDARDVNCIDMRRKAAVRCEDVVADVARALDHLSRIVTRIVQVSFGKAVLIDLVEHRAVATDALRAEFGGT